MLPSTRVVLEDPLLHGVSLNPEAWGLVATTDKLAVDLPLTVASLEPEGASNARRIGGIREAVEISARRNSCRVDTVVRHCRTIDDDLQYLVSLTSTQNVSCRTATVLLLQTVLDEERLSSVVGEIDDHVNSLGYREARAVYLNRPLQQIAVCRDLPERLGAVVWSQQEHLVEARRAGVQPAETITARAYVQHRLDLAVDKEFVAQNSVCIEQVESQQSGLVIEDFVVEHHVDIETGEWVLSVAEAWEAEAGVFITSIEFIEKNVCAGETFVSIFRRVIDAMVVIPKRVHRFLDIAGAGMC